MAGKPCPNCGRVMLYLSRRKGTIRCYHCGRVYKVEDLYPRIEYGEENDFVGLSPDVVALIREMRRDRRQYSEDLMKGFGVVAGSMLGTSAELLVDAYYNEEKNWNKAEKIVDESLTRTEKIIQKRGERKAMKKGGCKHGKRTRMEM